VPRLAFSDSINAWRSDTPVCEKCAHLNNAGAALQPRPVLEAVSRHLELETEIGGYEAAEEAAGAIEQCCAALGQLPAPLLTISRWLKTPPSLSHRRCQRLISAGATALSRLESIIL
jgi:hypothetical protein